MSEMNILMDCKLKKVAAVYFSPCGSTAAAAKRIGERLASQLGLAFETVDFTLPKSPVRQEGIQFDSSTLVVFGTPTYAGRVPNKVLPLIQACFRGQRTPAVALVTFGNRAFDSSLTELAEELTGKDFFVFAGAAIASRHVFSDKLAAGRPDESDFAKMDAFADQLAAAWRGGSLAGPVVIRGGEPVGPDYVPGKTDGSPAKFLKAKPKTWAEKCDDCGICAAVCPMGSIDGEDFSSVTGICIKCQACISKCPRSAKYFDDPEFLSHVAMLEENYRSRKEAEFYGTD